MLTKDCKNCSYLIWMIGVGQGVRCGHPGNQKYKPNDSNNLPVIISYIPSDCNYNTSESYSSLNE